MEMADDEVRLPDDVMSLVTQILAQKKMIAEQEDDFRSHDMTGLLHILSLTCR